MSDDGQHAILAIAMLGAAFSPYYASALRDAAPGEAPDPLEFSTLNVALYGPRGSAWSLTEYRARHVERAPSRLVVGPNACEWRRDALRVDFDDRTAPFAQRLRGRIELTPRLSPGREESLDEEGRHRWWPIAPSARVVVDLAVPRLRFEGHGYLDANVGSEPLARSLAGWRWAHAETERGAAVTYSVQRRDGSERRLALLFDRAGRVRPVHRLEPQRLPRTAFGLRRRIDGEPGRDARLVRTLEDTPFYARSLVDGELAGERARFVHETLDLDRLERSWVQFLLPFRMRRAAPGPLW